MPQVTKHILKYWGGLGVILKKKKKDKNNPYKSWFGFGVFLTEVRFTKSSDKHIFFWQNWEYIKMDQLYRCFYCQESYFIYIGM